MFPFSLNEAARLWFNSLTPNSINTWEEMVRKFMLKYFPPSRIVQFRNEITSFVQLETESFYDALERFKELFKEVPISWYSAMGTDPDLLQWTDEPN